MDYTNLISRNLPATVEMPPGQQEDTRFTFSVTYTDKDTMPVDGFVSALADNHAERGGRSGEIPAAAGTSRPARVHRGGAQRESEASRYR